MKLGPKCPGQTALSVSIVHCSDEIELSTVSLIAYYRWKKQSAIKKAKQDQALIQFILKEMTPASNERTDTKHRNYISSFLGQSS